MKDSFKFPKGDRHCCRKEYYLQYVAVTPLSGEKKDLMVAVFLLLSKKQTTPVADSMPITTDNFLY
jgi:hypothetical protein